MHQKLNLRLCFTTDIPAERASIIYSLDPVYGVFFSRLLLNESLGGTQAYFGKLIVRSYFPSVV
jgi:hypothetical protein